MCGRYASFREDQALADEFAIATVADDVRLLPPSWNVAPTDGVRMVGNLLGDPAAPAAIGAEVEAFFEDHEDADPPYTLVQWRRM